MVRWILGSVLRRLMGRAIATELRTFFGTDPSSLPTHNRRFPAVDLPNIQLAIDSLAEHEDGTVRVVGYSSDFDFMGNSLGQLVGSHVRVGSITYRHMNIGKEETLPCVENGVHLVEQQGVKAAVHVRQDNIHGQFEVEVMSSQEDSATELLSHIFSVAAERSVFRGKILSLESNVEARAAGECCTITFQTIPEVTAGEIILPTSLKETLERNTVKFFKHAGILRKSGRSVRRGILLFGPPGTGKTFTAKWLAQSLEDVTVILLSGEQLWMIKDCCQIATQLAPSLVIMEDVDLVASKRDSSRHPQYDMTLHQLLNEMDGISESAEVLFLMTTNRADIIEPAISARPGRIDQAIEYPLPDKECRKRLLSLYSAGLTLTLSKEDELVDKLDGASPAFIRELLRKAAIFAAEDKSVEDDALVVKDGHCDAALREMVLGGGSLTRELLGFTAADAPERFSLSEEI